MIGMNSREICGAPLWYSSNRASSRDSPDLKLTNLNGPEPDRVELEVEVREGRRECVDLLTDERLVDRVDAIPQLRCRTSPCRGNRPRATKGAFVLSGRLLAGLRDDRLPSR